MHSPAQTFCPKHFTLEDVDCEEAIVACPPRVPLDPAIHAIVTCGPCDRTRVVPVDRIMKGTVIKAGTCVMDSCAATILDASTMTTGPVIPDGILNPTPPQGINQAARPRKAGKAQ